MTLLSEIITAGSGKSSARFSLVLWACSIALVILSIVFHVIWRTIHPVEVVWLGPSHLESHVVNVDWTALGIFLTGLLAGATALLFGKAKTKTSETGSTPEQAGG